MSLDLSRALHGAVDVAHGDDRPLDVDLASLGRRIRRRRHIRAGVRAGVGVAAVGAVALTVPQLARGSSGAPAGLPVRLADANPGSCGSGIDQLRRPTTPEAGLTTHADVTHLVVPAAGGSLGTYVGDRLKGTIVEKLPPSVRAQQAESAREQAQTSLHQAQAQLVEIQAQQAELASRSAQPGLTATERSVVEAQKQAADAAQEAARTEVTAAQAHLDALASGGELSDRYLGLSHDARVLVTYAGTVVATDAINFDYEMDTLDAGTGVAAIPVEQSLVTCNAADQPGGEPLPAGTYEVYVAYARDDDHNLSKAAGPWTLTVARPASATDLPNGFPRDLPLVPGPVDSAVRDGEGWVVEIATDATDRLDAAYQRLQPVLASPSPAVVESDGTLNVSGDASTAFGDANGALVRLADGRRWEVVVSDDVRGDQTALRYQVRPAGS